MTQEDRVLSSVLNFEDDDLSFPEELPEDEPLEGEEAENQNPNKEKEEEEGIE